MKRVVTIILVLAAVGVGWLLYGHLTGNNSSDALQGITTAPVTRDVFEARVSATGSVRAERTQALAFNTAGTIAEIMVEAGDLVTAGQVLARLDDTNMVLNLRQAEAALAIAEAQRTRTVVGPTDQDLAVAEASVDIARVGVQTAEAGVSAARANLNRVQAGATAEEIAIAERRVEEAKNALWGAQAQRDAICGRVGVVPTVSQADCDQANATTQRSEEGVRIADLQLEQIWSGARPQDVAGAQAQVDQALSQLENARAQVVRAEAEFERATRGASAEDIAIADAQVAQAEVNVQIARRRLDDAVLVAPAPGTIATVNMLVGDAAAPGNPVATLVDAEAYHMVVNIDETEIGRIREGQEAKVVLDAYLGQPLQGEVTRVALTGANVQGIVVYDVRVEINSENADLVIRPMMTASVDITVARRDDALLVSSRALRRDAQGRYVEIVENGQIERVPVEIGATSLEFTEVLSGLEEGQEVVVGRPRDGLFDFSLGGG